MVFLENNCEQKKEQTNENYNQLVDEKKNLSNQQKENDVSSILAQCPSFSIQQTPLKNEKSVSLYTNPRSSIRPIPPNKAEVQALAARFIAVKRPGYFILNL
jgi:hypothetical protein